MSLSADQHLARGRQLLNDGQPGAAIRDYLAANALQPANPQAALGLGMALSLAGRHGEARIALEHALTLAPENSDYAFALAEAHKRAGNRGTAEKIYRQILHYEPQHLMSAHNLGALLYDEERFAEAAERHLATLNDHPASVATWRDLGQSLIAAGRLEDGITTLEIADQTFPDDRETRFALGLAYLRNEEWSKGWPLYEARWQAGEQSPTPPGTALWAGQPLTGKHLVITREQGFGDNIMFVRYLPHLAREAAHITLLAPAPLAILFAESFSQLGNVSIVTTPAAVPAADFCTAIGSLPGHCLARGLSAPPSLTPYLRTPPERLSAARQALLRRAPEAGQKLGLVWRGNQGYGADRQRSLALGELLGQLPTAGVRYFNLQLDTKANERRLLNDAGVFDLSAEITGFHDTAAWLGALDGLICVDTAIAHLAGALARPTRLLGRREGEWRWGRAQDGRAWYTTLFPGKIGEAALFDHGATIAFPQNN